MTNNIKLSTIHVILPLLVGGILYISFRSPSLLMFDWFNNIGIDGVTNSIKDASEAYNIYLPSWAYYSLPDGLWTYSFTSALLICWNNEFHKLKYWLLIPFTASVLVEILQGFKLFPGTFDTIDLLFCITGLALSISILTNYKIKLNEKRLL